jgi:hypothetical protein
MIREVKIICFYYLKSIYIKNLSSRIFILFWIDYGIWGDFFFFFLCFWRLMIGLTRFQEYFLCVLGNNELKICFWMKKNKNPIFSATTVAEIWGIINDWCALYFFFVKEWGGWHIVHTINLKKKKTHALGPFFSW